MYKQKHFLWLAGFSLLCMCIYSCKEEKNGPLPNAGRQPVQVSNVLVQNLNGGALLTYTLPKNGNVRYVEAEWSVHGITHTTKASVYTDTLMVQGFGDTLEHEIKLYSVNPGGKKSAPVAVTIKPLRAPVNLIMDSLFVRPDLGGITATFVNRTKASIMISVLARDSVTGKLKTIGTHSTNLAKDSISIKGYPPVKKEFGFYVKDQWNNYTDTIYKDLAPLAEIALDKSKFSVIELPGDINGNYWSGLPWEMMFDNNLGSFMNTADQESPLMPNLSLALDLGVTKKLDRVAVWLRNLQIYARANIRVFEIWGRQDPPVGNGDWSNWTKLGHFEIIKPSGLPPGEVSNADVQAATVTGFSFRFPINIPKVRYIRIKFISSWDTEPAVWVAEMSFWAFGDQ